MEYWFVCEVQYSWIAFFDIQTLAYGVFPFETLKIVPELKRFLRGKVPLPLALGHPHFTKNHSTAACWHVGLLKLRLRLASDPVSVPPPPCTLINQWMLHKFLTIMYSIGEIGQE